MTGTAAGDAYYRAIEEEFVRRRGAPLLLSPRDWRLIGEWREAGIPLRIVLQGIDNVFDGFERRAASGSRARRINSLAYCRQEVLALHDLYRSLQAAEAGRAGAAGTTPAQAVGRHLGRLLRAVRGAMAAASAAGRDPLVGVLAGAAADLKRWRREARTGGAPPADLEAALERLEAAILEAARAALPPEQVQTLERAAGDALADRRGRMTAEAFEATRRAHLARGLRRACGLPRLSLFDPGG
jgi:hypothetical protein